jgi:hypothetical protein
MSSYQVPRLLTFGSAIAFSVLFLEAFMSFVVSIASPVQALDIGDGRAVFTKSPQLIRAAASNTSAGSASSVYRFAVKVPQDAGKPLKALTIIQNNSKPVEFDLSNSKAFMGDSFAGGTPVAINKNEGSKPTQNKSTTLIFDRPVAPGNTVTVALKAKENPQFGGIYQFGVMAYPKGERSTSLYLGSRSLAFTQH